MKTPASLESLLLSAVAICLHCPVAAAQDVAAGLQTRIGDRDVIVKHIDVTPVVRNQFSARYDFDCFDRSELKRLREQEKLDDVMATGTSEFGRQVLLLDWAHRRIKLFGPPKSRPGGPLDLLKRVDAGEAFNCSSYASLLRNALSACGYVARSVGLKGAKSDGNGAEHGVVEVWSNQYRKWIVLDPTLSIYFEGHGLPLNAFEVRQDWFYNEGKGLTIVVGAERGRYSTADMPLERGCHKGFGTLMLRPESIGKFLYIAYTPVRPDGRPDYGRMFITKDKLCVGVTYHARICPPDPARDPYWPVQQAALRLVPGDGAALKVELDHMMPDFAGYRHRVDDGQWQDGAPAVWPLKAGQNTLVVASVNKFGIQGVPSEVVLEIR